LFNTKLNGQKLEFNTPLRSTALCIILSYLKYINAIKSTHFEASIQYLNNYTLLSLHINTISYCFKNTMSNCPSKENHIWSIE